MTAGDHSKSVNQIRQVWDSYRPRTCTFNHICPLDTWRDDWTVLPQNDICLYLKCFSYFRKGIWCWNQMKTRATFVTCRYALVQKWTSFILAITTIVSYISPCHWRKWSIFQMGDSTGLGDSTSVLDFMSMKNYPDMSLDITMLNSLGNYCH